MDSAVLDKLTVVKHVGFIGGSCLLFNQMTGPAIPFTGASFQNPGWLFTGVMYAVLTIVAGFAALFLVEAIQSIPGNSHFQGTVEYGTLVNFFFGKRLHLAAQFFVYGALMSSAIASIVITAQTTDNLMIALFSKSCGLSFTRGWICVAGGSTSPSPFGNEFMVFTIGLLVVVVCCLPLGLADFDNNIVFNIITAALSMLLAVAWIVCAFATGADAERLRMIEPVQTSYALVVGTILLNLACPTVVPSWINVKHKETNVQAMIWTVVIGTSLFCILIGLVTGAGFDTNGTGNVLYALFTYGKPTVLATLSAGVFAFIMLLPGIPVSFIVSFNNLVQNEVVSPSIATFLSFFLPWIILAPLQTGNIIYTMQVWTSLFFCSTANYILPFVIYFKCVEFRREYNTKRILTKNQIKVLLKVHHISPAIISFISVKRLKFLGQPSPFADTTAVDLPQIVVVESAGKDGGGDRGDSGEQVPQPAASAADAVDGRDQQARLAQTAANSQHHLSPHANDNSTGIVINNSVSISSAPRKSSVMSRPSADSARSSPSPQRHNSPRHSHSSRDSRVAFRPEFANASNNAMFMDPAEAGIPLQILEDDIPDNDDDQHTRRHRHHGRHHSHHHDSHEEHESGSDHRQWMPSFGRSAMDAADPAHALASDETMADIHSAKVADVHGHHATVQPGRQQHPDQIDVWAEAERSRDASHGRRSHGSSHGRNKSDDGDSRRDQRGGTHQRLPQTSDSQPAAGDDDFFEPLGLPMVNTETGLLNPLDTPAPHATNLFGFGRLFRRADRHHSSKQHQHHQTHHQTRHHEPRRRSFSSSCSSSTNLSLPHEPGFVAEPFRVIPRWSPLSEKAVAWMALLTTSAVCVCNMIFYLIVSA